MIRAARAGKCVVRLKGGDPFVFGRGAEEALALAMAGIPFEVVPGVSTAIAAPELAGIPVTHRGSGVGVSRAVGSRGRRVRRGAAGRSAERGVAGRAHGTRGPWPARRDAHLARLEGRHAGRDRLRRHRRPTNGYGRARWPGSARLSSAGGRCRRDGDW